MRGMSSAPVAVLVVTITVSAVLLVSGLAKLRDAQATRDAFDALSVPAFVPRGPGARVLPWAELGLGVLLLIAPRGWLVVPAAAVVALMLAYTALVARAMAFDESVACSCFGSLGRHDVDRTTLARNVLLTVLAATVLVFALTGDSVPSAVASLEAAGWWSLLAAVAAAAVAVLVIGSRSESAATDEVLDYERQPIPFGVLATPDTTASLWELTSTQARLLVVLKPSCAPCTRTAERLDDWAAQLAPAVGVIAVYPDEPSASAATQHAADLAAWEPEGNIRRTFSVGTPAAVLLGADGFLAGGPVAGESSVADFVDEILDALVEQPTPSE